MIKTTIYHHSKCSRSRSALAYLKTLCSDFEIRDYIRKPFQEDELRLVLQKLNLPADAIVRSCEVEYRKKLRGKHFHEHEWIQILLENHRLIARPIVVRGNRAVVADPPETINTLFLLNK